MKALLLSTAIALRQNQNLGEPFTVARIKELKPGLSYRDIASSKPSVLAKQYLEDLTRMKDYFK